MTDDMMIGQLGLQLDDAQHERRGALLHRGVPSLFEPAEQDLGLLVLDRPPGRPEVPHPFGDGGPVQQLVPGLPGRALGIACLPPRPGGVAGGGARPAEILLTEGEARIRGRSAIGCGFVAGGRHNYRRDGFPFDR